MKTFEKKFWYFVHFKYRDGGLSEHTSVICLDDPIEYASDLELVTRLCADGVGVKEVMLVHWAPLIAKDRPTTKVDPRGKTKLNLV